MNTVTAARRNKMGWQQSVADMVSRRAEASGQEMSELVAYLTKYFGKIDVNTATIEQLEEFLGLDRQGTFKDFEQLKAVPDVSIDSKQDGYGIGTDTPLWPESAAAKIRISY